MGDLVKRKLTDFLDKHRILESSTNKFLSTFTLEIMNKPFSTSAQTNPLPEYPDLQEHVKDWKVLVQTALPEQYC